jgi:hypothetical protein
MGTTATLLARLEGVRESAPGRWMARCPAHEDKSPSLSIRELEDERILIYCHAGCSAPDVLVAIGLSLADLFPRKLEGDFAPARHAHAHAAAAALKSIDSCALLVAIAAENLALGLTLDAADRKKVVDAAARIRTARLAVSR